MKYDADGPIVVLSPHLDDAILSTFSILTSGDDVRVVNVFAGIPPAGTLSLWDRICGYDDSKVVAEARIREDVAALAAAQANGAPPVYLGFCDSLVREALGDPDPLIEVVLSEIDAVAESARLILGPLGGSDRPSRDHLIAREATIQLLYGWGGGDPIDAALYADFPHVCKARGAWPRELVDPETTNFHQPVKIVGAQSPPPRWVSRVPRDVPEVDPLYDATIVLLPDDVAEAKRAAMETYETQFSALDRKLRTKGLVSNPALYGIEAFVPLRAR